MKEIFILCIKIAICLILGITLGKKMKLFSLKSSKAFFASIILLVLAVYFVYVGAFLKSFSLYINLSTSVFSYSLNLGFYVVGIIITLILGLICTAFGKTTDLSIKDVRSLCYLAMLLAVSIVLGIYSIRVGSMIKISFKFIPVFITAIMFGPFWAGAIASLSDILSYFVNSAGGAFIPQISAIEFFYGFTFGLVFYNSKALKSSLTSLKIVLCVVFQIVFLNLLLTSYALMPILNIDKIETVITMRALACLINMALQIFVLIILTRYTPQLIKKAGNR